MMRIYKIFGIVPVTLILMFIFGFVFWNDRPQEKTDNDFGDYWFQGKAEIVSYELQQNRYGEIHEGDAVLIFVTEDFLPDQQVKYEYGPAPENLTKVLKLNFTRKFYTGIYPYSMMSSVFTPLNNDRTLKVNTSVQEWCGHTFMQLNASDRGYSGHLFSYFQREGDQQFNIERVLLEDEIWTKLRMSPESLPTGEIRLFPGTQYLRLLHQPPLIQSAVATKTILDNRLHEYRIEYKDIERSLIIQYESVFPYVIQEWREITGPVSSQRKTLTTIAKKKELMLIDYWNKNSVKDSELVSKLGLN